MIPMLEAALLVRAAQSSAGAPAPDSLQGVGSERHGATNPEAPAAALVFRPRGVIHVTTDPLTPSGRRLTTGGRTACRARTRRLSVMPRGEASRVLQSRRVCARCKARLAGVQPGLDGRPLSRDAELAAFSFLTVANLATVTRSCTTVAQTHEAGRLALMLFGPEPLTPKARRTPEQQALVDLHQLIHATRRRLVPAERTEEEQQALRDLRDADRHDQAERRKATRRAAAVENAQERRRAGGYLTPAERDLLTTHAN